MHMSLEYVPKPITKKRENIRNRSVLVALHMHAILYKGKNDAEAELHPPYGACSSENCTYVKY